MRTLGKAYLGIEDETKHKDMQEDPFISPILVSDNLLSKLPPVRMTVAATDPLHDDCMRLVGRLR